MPKGQYHFPEGEEKLQDTATESAVGSPPYYLGRSWTTEEFQSWIKTHQLPVTDPVIAKIVNYIRVTYDDDVKIGGVGYCFGGRHVFRLMGSGVIVVGVVNHPSFFTMEEVQKLGTGKKLAIFATEKDDILPPAKRRATQDVLTREGATWMSTVFSGSEHGFSVRGDLNVKEVRFAKEKLLKELWNGLMIGYE